MCLDSINFFLLGMLLGILLRGEMDDSNNDKSLLVKLVFIFRRVFLPQVSCSQKQTYRTTSLLPTAPGVKTQHLDSRSIITSFCLRHDKFLMGLMRDELPLVLPVYSHQDLDSQSEVFQLRSCSDERELMATCNKTWVGFAGTAANCLLCVASVSRRRLLLLA